MTKAETTRFSGAPASSTRTDIVAVVLCGLGAILASGTAYGLQAAESQPHATPKAAPSHFGSSSPVPRSAPRGEHLAQWMQQHNRLNPQQQQHALEKEPGFQQLPRETQQRMSDRLQRLNNMPPQQRERVLQRSEAIEKLQPEQRSQVRSAMGQLGGLPQDRRRLIAKSFRDLRNLPPEQRNSLLNSQEYRQQFSEEERGTLGNLLEVSPLLPPSR